MTRASAIAERSGGTVTTFLHRLLRLAARGNTLHACGSHVAGGVVRWMCSPVDQPVPAEDVDVFPPDAARFEALEARLLKQLVVHVLLAPRVQVGP